MWQTLRNAIARRHQRQQQRSIKASRNRQRLRHELLEDRRLMVGDALVRYEFTDTANQVVQSLSVNQEFRLNVFVSDIRSNPFGVFGAFLDINYPASLATATGPITPGSTFAASASGTTSSAGLIDEAGGVDSDQVPPTPKSQENLLFSVPLRATAAGVLSLTADRAENPAKGFVLFDGVSSLAFNRIDFVGGSINIVAAGVQLSRTSELVTTEAGGSDTFTAVLTSQPTSEVSFTVSSSDTTEGTVPATPIVFSTTNWNVPQTITVTGVNDAIDDDNVAYTIITSAATSGDSRYSGAVIADVSVTNQDDADAAGFNFSTTNVVTNENPAANTATFAVRLSSEPTSNVIVNLSSSNTGEATVTPTSLVFTPQNWLTNQTVTVTGVDDTVIDGPMNYTIVTSVSVPQGGDAKYAVLNPPDVSGINDDNDVLTQVILSRTSGLLTTESGGTDTFTAVLSAAPTSNVSFSVSSSRPTEGTVAPSSVTFSPSDWNVPKTITITGVNDAVDDDDVPYTIITSNTTSADLRYNNLIVPDVSVTNQDDTDTAGYTIAPLGSLVTSENATGNTANFTVRLNSQPTVDVTIDLLSSNTSEGTVSPARLFFTANNWNTPQTVTVTGQDDSVVDGDVAYQIITTEVTADPKYSSLNPPDVNVLNTDNDVRSVLVSRTTGLVVTEAGGTDTFTLRLSQPPTANVSITLNSGNNSEGTVAPGTVTFTPENWDVAQTVTVTGVDDNGADDGDRVFTIFTSVTSSTDSNFNGLPVPDVNVTNTDDDTAEITVAPTSGLSTSESGITDTFMVVLRSRPTADVAVNLANQDTVEVSIDTTSLLFTPANWNTPQIVTVTGIADNIIDGSKAFLIRTEPAISTDTAYSGMDAPDVTGLNVDINSASVTVTPTSLSTSEPNSTATFVVRLSAQPTADVTLNLTSNDTTEGTVSPSTVTLTPSNWLDGVTVTVTSADDDVVDGPIVYSVSTSNTTSSDTPFNNLNVPDVTVTNADDDVAGVIVEQPTSTTTSELLQSTIFRLRLTSQPTADVSIPLRSSDTSEGSLDVQSLTFTAANWNAFQTVTVTGVNDDIDDGDVAYTISTDPATSSDTNYAGVDADDVELTNADDDDSAGISVTAQAGLTTTEEGAGTATFQVVLDSQPTADVVIPVSSSNTGEGTVAPTPLTFTAANWNQPQTVTITGVDDAIDDDDVQYSVVLSPATSGDAKYSGLDAEDVTVTNIDDDVAGFSIRPTVGLVTSETESTATFEIVLTQQPMADVVIGLSSSDETEGLVSVSSVTFTPTNWDTPQTVTVRGVADNRVDGDQSYRIVTAMAVSDDPFFAVINPPDVRLTNQDIDSATLTIVGPGSIDEGDTGTTEFAFEVTLDAAVEGGFTLAFNTVDGTATVADGDYLPQSSMLTFAGIAGESQTARVQVTAESMVELDETFQLVLGALSNTIAGISSRITVPTSPFTATITNDDAATVAISPPIAMNEGTGAAPTEFVFLVTLSAPVQGGFSVDFDSVDGTATAANDFVAASGSLTFSGENSETQSIRVQVNADDAIEADEMFQVVLGQLDGLVAGLESSVTITTSTASATILNDDTATLSISGPVSLTEGTGNDSTEFVFTVTLSDAVQGGFSVGYATNDGTATVADNDFVSNTGTLAFDGTAGETRTITVLVDADDRVESDETFAVVLGAITGISPDFTDDLTIATGTATTTILNDDFARLVLTDTTTNRVEGTSADGFTDFTFTVLLTDAIIDANGFDVPLTINDGTATLAGGDYIDNDMILHFDGDAPQTQTITVRVRQDDLVEGDETFTVSLGEFIGLAAGQTIVVDTPSVTASISDDDSATLTLSAAQSSRPEGDVGSTDYVFDVTLSSPVQGGFQVAYNTNDRTATLADTDYVDNDGSLDFTSVLARQITVQVNGDTKVEADELFEVALGAISGLNSSVMERVTVVGSPVTATITNDDTAMMTITGPGTLNEGTGDGTTAFEFTVTLDNAIASQFTLSYETQDGIATVADSDYINNDAVLSFMGTAGESKTIRVLVNQDAKIEADETFRVLLGQISGLSSELAGKITVSTTPVVATIRNDDSATVAFAQSTSSVLEADGTLNVPVRLSVTGGGSITQPISLNVVARSGGSASASDFTLATTSVTFPSGSVDGAVQNVRLVLAQDGLVEEAETILLGLELAGGGANSVSLGQTTTHTISVVDDPRDASLSGRVWVDADNSGTLDIGERTVPSVVVRLSGTTLGGESITRQMHTDQNGFYRFTDLPAGTYSLTQSQPTDFIDGRMRLGSVSGASQGLMSNNAFSGIVIGPSQTGSGYHFGEAGMHAASVNQYRILSRPRTEMTLGNSITADMLAAQDQALLEIVGSVG